MSVGTRYLGPAFLVLTAAVIGLSSLWRLSARPPAQLATGPEAGGAPGHGSEGVRSEGGRGDAGSPHSPLRGQTPDSGERIWKIEKVEPKGTEVAAEKPELRSSSFPRSGVLLEAEDGRVSPPMIATDESDASGGRCVEVPRGTPRNARGAGGVTWQVRLEQGGTYSLWGRVWWPDDCGNSFYAVVDGGTRKDFGNDGTHRAWHWVALRNVRLDAGSHAISLLFREDGARLDQALLTADADAVPVGVYKRLGEAGGLVASDAGSDLLFADSFGRTAAAGLAPWEPVAGTWGIDSTADPNGIPNFFALKASGAGPATLTAGFDFWKDYRVSAVVRPANEKGAGVVFAYLGKDRFLRASVERRGGEGLARLVRVTPEGEVSMGEARAPLRPASWTRIEVRAAAGSVWEERGASRRDASGRIELLVDGERVLDVAAPFVGSGKVGLWAGAPGEGVHFDRFEVRALRTFREVPGAQTGGWTADKDGWLAANDGAWADREATARFTAAADSTIELALGGGAERVACSLDSKASRIVLRSKDGECELARGPAAFAPGTPANLRLTSIEGRVVVELDDGERISAWAAPATGTDAAPAPPAGQGSRPGSAGAPVRLTIRCGGDPIAWDRFESRQIGRDEDARIVAWNSFRADRVASMSDFEGLLTDADIEAMGRSAQAEFLRRVPEFHRVLGQLWQPRSAGWRIQNGALACQAGTAAATVWAAERSQAPGAVEARVRAGAGARAGVALADESFRPDRTVTWTLGASGAAMDVGGKVVAKAAISMAPDSWHSVRLSRRSGWLVGLVDGRSLAAAREPAPDLCRWGLACSNGGAQFGDATLSAFDRGGGMLYTFEDPESDWSPAEGEWPIHTGIACIWASTWITARPGADGGAVLWNKRPFGPDATIMLEAFEYSQWYGWDRDPSHQHFPYQNIGFALAASDEDLASGYAVVIGGWDQARTCIFRLGRKVAEVEQDARFPIRKHRAGGHTPLEPRAAAVRVELKDGKLRVVVCGTEVLRYADPEPLRGARAGLWTWGRPLNVRTVGVIGTGPSPFRGLAPPPGIGKAPRTSVRAFLEAAGLGM